MATGLSSVREGGEIDKSNLTTTLTDILREMQNTPERQRVGGSKRKNLEVQLERLNKAIQWNKPEIEPKEEQSTDVGKVEVGKVRDARNLGVGKAGRGNMENCRPMSHAQVVGKPKVLKITIISIGVGKTGCATRNTGVEIIDTIRIATIILQLVRRLTRRQ